MSSHNLRGQAYLSSEEIQDITYKIKLSFIYNKASQDVLANSLAKTSNALYGKFKSAKEKILSSDIEELAKTEALSILKDSYHRQIDFIKKDAALFQLEAEALEIKEEYTNLLKNMEIISDDLRVTSLNYIGVENAEVSIKAQNNLHNAHTYYDRLNTLLVRTKQIEEETKDLAVKTEAMIKHYASYEAALSSSDEILDISLDYYEPPKIVISLKGIYEMKIIDGKTIISLGGNTLSFEPGVKVEISGSSAITDDATAIDAIGECSAAADYSE